jgi:hypothetical protein
VRHTGAAIHYTIDGSTPNESSPTFDAYQLPVLEAINDGDRGVSTTYTVKAFAISDRLAPSDVATFTYVIDRRAKDAYLTTEVSPGIYTRRHSVAYLHAGREQDGRIAKQETLRLATRWFTSGLPVSIRA